MAGPDRDFWQQRFEQGATPWDRGSPNPQLVEWLDTGALAPCRIAVPGCGSGHEVELLASRGFDVVAIDYAPAAVERTRQRLARAGLQARIEQADVLQWRPGVPLDAVYEQTCLCALHPDHWVAYAARLADWLSPGGRLHALLMQVPRPGAADGLVEGPPYHCDVNAVRALLREPLWRWPRPPYRRIAHPAGSAELAVVLERAAGS